MNTENLPYRVEYRFPNGETIHVAAFARWDDAQWFARRDDEAVGASYADEECPEVVVIDTAQGAEDIVTERRQAWE